MNDDIEQEPIEEESAETHYEKARIGFSLFDGTQDEVALKPYSPSRVIAAQKIGVRFPLIGEEQWNGFADTGTYPGIIEDCILLLWICSLPDTAMRADQWTPSRAAAKPLAAKVAAIGWGAKLQIHDMMGEHYQEAVQVFLAIVQGVEASKFKLRVPGQEETQQDDGSPKV